MILSSLIFLIISIVFLVFYILFLNLFRYKGGDDTFFNTFGSEFYMKISLKKRIVLYVLLLLFTTFINMGLFMSFSYYNSIYLILTALSFSISVTLISVSNITPLSQYKLHLITYFVGITSFATTNLLLFISYILDLKNYILSIRLPLFVAIIAVILFITCFIFITNPNNSNCFKLVQKTENDNVKYVKPKYNALVIEEWVSFILLSIFALVIIILDIINLLMI